VKWSFWLESPPVRYIEFILVYAIMCIYVLVLNLVHVQPRSSSNQNAIAVLHATDQRQPASKTPLYSVIKKSASSQREPIKRMQRPTQPKKVRYASKKKRQNTHITPTYPP
jgi:hypothetical protein